jgi:hypothetical protein
MDGGQPVSPVTLQMLNSLIDTQTRLRDAAEVRWAMAREALFDLARLVASDWLEQKQHEKGGLEAIRIEELTQVVYQQVSALQAVALVPASDQLQKVSERNEELSREIGDLAARAEQGEKLKKELETAHRKHEGLLDENERLKDQIEKLKSTSPASNSGAAFPAPAWFTDWAKSKGFEKQSFALKLIGSTGISLRQDILNAIADRFAIEADTNSARGALDGLVERGFILFSDINSGERGRPPKTASFTALGEAAFVFLTRELPCASDFEAMRPFHSTDEHTFLVMKAVEILEVEGYKIISKGEINIPLQGNHLSSPDILAGKGGKEIQVEVERDVSKGNNAARERKWQNAFDAGKGNIHVFCENPAIQKQLIQEINHALAAGARLERASIYMTNLKDIKAGKRHKDGSIWLSQKKSPKIHLGF